MADIAVRAQTRHLLISLALKRQKRGSGSTPEFLHERTAKMLFPDLTTPLNGIRWAVVGAAATRLYMPERMTNDLDILVRTADSAATRERLQQAGATFEATGLKPRAEIPRPPARTNPACAFVGEGRRCVSERGFNPVRTSWTLADGFPLDVLESNEKWVAQALTEAQTNRGADGLPTLPLPYLVLMKFQASRVQDLADISRMLGQAEPKALDAVRAVFSRWQPDGNEDLESLILLGQMEN